MAFAQSEIPKEIQDEADLYADAKDKAMGLASFLGSFMLPGSAGFTNPSGSKVTAITKSAKESRKLLYDHMKALIPKGNGGILSGIKRVITNLGKEQSDQVLSKAQAIRQYSDAVKEITAIPDPLMARMNKVEPVKKKLADWGEDNKTLGLSSNFDRGSISHELAGHNATGWGKEQLLKVLKNHKTRRQFNNLNPEAQQTVKDLAALENFDFSNLTRRFNSTKELETALEKYADNYTQWPSEIFSAGLEGKIPRGRVKKGPDIIDEARSLGRRLNMEDYQKFSKPSLEKGLKSMKDNFPKDYEYHIKYIDELLK